MTDNEYFKAEPLVQDVAKALAVGQTPYTLNFFELINSPQGPWLQMLQRVYYTDDPIDQIIADAKDADEGDRQPVGVTVGLTASGRGAAHWRRGPSRQRADAPTRSERHSARANAGADMYSTRSGKMLGLLYLAPALALRRSSSPPIRSAR